MLLLLTVGATVLATWAMTSVLPYHGRQPLEVLVLVLFAILFFFIGIIILGIGIVGEYVGRIYQEVRKRPRFVVRNTYGFD